MSPPLSANTTGDSNRAPANTATWKVFISTPSCWRERNNTYPRLSRRLRENYNFVIQHIQSLISTSEHTSAMKSLTPWIYVRWLLQLFTCDDGSITNSLPPDAWFLLSHGKRRAAVIAIFFLRVPATDPTFQICNFSVTLPLSSTRQDRHSLAALSFKK